MGNFEVLVCHLKMILENVTAYDLRKDDKVNFDATMTMCSSRVTAFTKEYLPSLVS